MSKKVWIWKISQAFYWNVESTFRFQENSVRDKNLNTQIAYWKLNLQPRRLQRNLRIWRKTARSKQRKIKKLFENIKVFWMEYGARNKQHTVKQFWRFVHFTDEAHLDVDEVFQGRILREEGTVINSENMQEMSSKELGHSLHFEARISYWDRSFFLFYNDNKEVIPDIVVKSSKKIKPSRREGESNEHFENRLTAWEVKLLVSSQMVDIKVRGNSMTQYYYTKNILPIYIEGVQYWRKRIGKIILQEDNDPFHRTRFKWNFAWRHKRKTEILKHLLIHPANSSDLNSIEGLWNILKQRIRHYKWDGEEELKALLQAEWHRISQLEIQRRIDEMPERCRRVYENGGALVKSELW